MTDFVNKIITLFMIFLLLVVAPLLISYMSTELTTQRLVLNEVTQFLDRVTDKASVLETDINDLYLGVNAHGGSFDVSVKRYVRVASERVDEKTGENVVNTLYFSNEDLEECHTGDVIKVTVEEIGISPAKRILWNVLRIDSGKFKFSLAGAVR